MLSKTWGVPDFCQLILITYPEILRERRPVVQRFLNVLEPGLDFLHQHPRKARNLYFDHTDTDPDSPLVTEIFEATVPCFTFNLQMNPDYYAGLAEWMKHTELIDDIAEPSHYWTNALISASSSFHNGSL